MANLTQYSQKKLLDHTLGLSTFTMPTAYAALFTSSPGEAGSLEAEVTGGSYARVELTSKMAATTLATGIATNSSAVTFAAPTADWGMVSHFGIIDDGSPGNMLMYAPLRYRFFVANGDAAPNFPIGSILLQVLFTSLTKYLAKKWLDHLLGIASFTAPADCYLGLFSADPTSDGSLTNEISGGTGNDDFTKIMLHFDGTDGSTAFIDDNAGGSTHQWIVTNTAQMDTAQSKFGGASGLFNGSSWISAFASSDFNLGNSDFTIDLWVRPAVDGSLLYIAGQGPSGLAAATTPFGIVRLPSNVIRFALSNGTVHVNLDGTTPVVAGAWYHIACTRSGNDAFLYINGSQEATSGFTATVPSSINSFRIGLVGEDTFAPWNGWIDEFRLSVGVARAAVLPTAAYVVDVPRQNISTVMDETVLATGIAANGGPIAFPSAVADYNVTNFAVLDALLAGNVLLRKARGATLRVLEDSGGIRVDVNGLQLSAD